FYDDRGNDRFVRGPGTSVDRRHYDEPPRDTSTLGRPRDWGSHWMPLTWVDYSPDIGLFVGAGADGTVYDFRRRRCTSQCGWAGAVAQRNSTSTRVISPGPRATGSPSISAGATTRGRWT